MTDFGIATAIVIVMAFLASKLRKKPDTTDNLKRMSDAAMKPSGRDYVDTPGYPQDSGDSSKSEDGNGIPDRTEVGNG